MRKVIGGLIIICLVLIVGWVGICIYANVTNFGETTYTMPDPEKARYSLRIINTGNYILTSKLIQDGNTLTVDGFWQLEGKKFKHHDGQITLDKTIFGPIEVLKRG